MDGDQSLLNRARDRKLTKQFIFLCFLFLGLNDIIVQSLICSNGSIRYFLYPWGFLPVFFPASAMTDQQPEQPVADTAVDTEQESQGESSACTTTIHPAYYFDSHLFACMHHPDIDS